MFEDVAGEDQPNSHRNREDEDKEKRG